MAKLVLVPTPIGNLEDITLRALRALKEADLIAAEDTRQSGKLLKHYSIVKPIVSLHQHNEHFKTPALIERIISEDLVLAMITDAGTPGISDPGFLMVREVLEAGIEVETLPGATALIPALVNSGLPIDRFVFEGFLPQKKGRNKRLLALAEERRTMVFYESPHRILKLLKELMEHFGGNRRAAISRELTKIHEETVRGTLEFLLNEFENRPSIKGEIVMVLEGKHD